MPYSTVQDSTVQYSTVQYSTVRVAMAALKITSLHCARLLSCPISRIWAAIFSDRNLPLGMLMVAI